MTEWIDIARWPEGAAMTRPGVVFELRNADGLTMRTPWVQPLPSAPFDWRSPPVAFRAIPEPPAVRSDPLPAPSQKGRQ